MLSPQGLSSRVESEGQARETKSLAEGRFVLQEVIGRGGASMVYRARDTALNIDRAVKVLRIDNPAIRERFLAEARTLARIRHPNVVRLVEYGELDGMPWMAIELAQGGTLAKRLSTGALRSSVAYGVVIELLAGLSALHVGGFVHRDVKPSNVLFGDDDEVWLSDLGVIGGSELVVDRMWRTSGALGTVGYQAPELRVEPQNADARADIYAVGATLFAALAARTPSDLSVIDLVPSVLDCIPPAAAVVVRRATSREPSDRYQSCEEMARAVAALRCDVDSSAPSVDASMANFVKLRRRAGAGGTRSPTPISPVSQRRMGGSERLQAEDVHRPQTMDRLSLVVAAVLLVGLCLVAAVLLGVI